jgi:signal transduction histidine kinase
LTGARLALQLFGTELPPGSDNSALEVALRQLTLMETNLKRFLDLGREGTRRERCDLAALVSEAVELLLPQCRHAAIDLRWEAPAFPAPVLGDAGQLGQLVLNLLGNAVEAAGPGGWIEIRTGVERPEKPAARRSPADPPADQAIVLEVTDSGSGPAPEVAGRLFEPFVTGKPEGVGLGLAVARQVAEAHGGSVGWSRASGHTCFRVELPLNGAIVAVDARREMSHS